MTDTDEDSFSDEEKNGKDKAKLDLSDWSD